MDRNALSVEGRKRETQVVNLKKKLWETQTVVDLSFRTINVNHQLLRLAVVAHDVGDGAGVDAAVLAGSLRDGQGVEDLVVPLVLVHGFNAAVRLVGAIQRY